MILYILILLVLSLTPVHTQGVCTPISCITSVHLNSTATSTRDLQYACRGEQLTFTCEVMNAASLQWVSEPDILCNNTISYTAGDNEGERRIKGFYQSYLISVARNPPNSNFTSNLTFIPPQSMDSVTVICGNQLSVCSSTEAERTVRITDVPMVPQGSLQYFIRSRESCPNISVLIQVDEIADVATLTYELNVSSSDGCVLEECPMLLAPGERVPITLLDDENYTATLEVSNDCGSNSTTILIQEGCEVGPRVTPGVRRVVDSGVVAGGVAAGVVGGVILSAVVGVVVVVIIVLHIKKNEAKKQEAKVQALENETKKQEAKVQALELYNAVIQCDIRQLRNLVGRGIKEVINESYDGGRTVLHLAARGNVEMGKLLKDLVDHRVNLNDNILRDLKSNAAGIDIVELLADQEAEVNIKDSDGRTPLHVAAEGGHEETVKYLISKGADVSVGDNEERTPLHFAAREGHEKTVEWLVNKGADMTITDKEGRTPLHFAAREGHEKTVEWLVNKGADMTITDKEGRTPLHFAAREGHEKTVEWLVNKGADMNITDKEGQTPLHIAVSESSGTVTLIVELLFDYEAEINIEDEYGMTPLHIAAERGYKKILEIFVEEGVDISIQNKNEMTPLDVAIKRDHGEIVQYLQSVDAKKNLQYAQVASSKAPDTVHRVVYSDIKARLEKDTTS